MHIYLFNWVQNECDKFKLIIKITQFIKSSFGLQNPHELVKYVKKKKKMSELITK